MFGHHGGTPTSTRRRRAISAAFILSDAPLAIPVRSPLPHHLSTTRPGETTHERHRRRWWWGAPMCQRSHSTAAPTHEHRERFLLIYMDLGGQGKREKAQCHRSARCLPSPSHLTPEVRYHARARSLSLSHTHTIDTRAERDRFFVVTDAGGTHATFLRIIMK